MTNFFKGRVNPAKWRPLRRGEPGYGSRQYVRKSVSRVTEDTPRLSLRRYQTAAGGRTLEERARANPRKRTEAQKEATAKKRRATATEKKLYGHGAKARELRDLKTMNPKKLAKLSPDDRNRLGFLAFHNRDANEDFLAMLYPEGIPQKKKRRSRASKESIMRAADRQNRRKAA